MQYQHFKNLYCGSGNCDLGIVSDFVLYAKNESEVQLALRHEVRKLRMVSSSDIDRCKPFMIDDQKRADEKTPGHGVLCTRCNSKLGNRMSFGPGGIPIVTFGIKKVRCEYGSFQKLFKSWSAVSKLPKCPFEIRTEATFVQQTEEQKSAKAKTQQALEARVPVDMIRYSGVPVQSAVDNDADEDGSDDVDSVFEWSDLLHTPFPPYPFQIEAYRISLVSNLIVVIPTGCGKTLIAAMSMHRSRKLNPHRSVLMVVNRIPLIYQQALAISSATQMSMLPLCGRSRTKASVGKLRDGVYDGAVITDGLLFELLASKQLRLVDFSLLVFDECHHATGDSKYKQLLEQVANVPLHLRPNLLGLSASPTSAATVAEAAKKFEQMQEHFIGAQVYRPHIEGKETAPVDEEWCPVALTLLQSQTQQRLAADLGNAVNGLCDMQLCSRLSVRAFSDTYLEVGSSRVDLQACKLEYSIVSPK